MSARCARHPVSSLEAVGKLLTSMVQEKCCDVLRLYSQMIYNCNGEHEYCWLLHHGGMRTLVELGVFWSDPMNSKANE